MGYDFSGYVTRNNLKCTDGRVIRTGAFKHQAGQIVPLVWQHQHDTPFNVLGHVKLEDRPDGVYGYAFLNNTDAGATAKKLIEHKDVESLSIFANRLKETNKNVLHGNINEVSLVLKGANPGAFIDNIQMLHGDDVFISEDEAVIYTGLPVDYGDLAVHSDDESTETEKEDKAAQEKVNDDSKEPEQTVIEEKTESLKHQDQPDNQDNKEKDMADEKTVKDVFDSLTEEQKNVVYFIIGTALEAEEAEEDEMKQSDRSNGEYLMHRNVFDSYDENDDDTYLTHDQIGSIFSDAKKNGSLKDSFLMHAQEYGIKNIDLLFPDAATIDKDPVFIARRMEWVAKVMEKVRKIPFSRIKTLAADITADEARARGYVKNTLKKEEIIQLLRRITTPATIYKKQKLDRDDVLDITDFDVVAWLKGEMRIMIDEEIARAILVGDGRESFDEAKIKDPAGANEGAGIRSILNDDNMYAHHVDISVGGTVEVTPESLVDSMIRARSEYKGSGTPTMYTTTDNLADMLLQKDKMGRRIYNTVSELASALRVDDVVEVPVMENMTRTKGADTFDLVAIIVNLTDYSLGTDKGGQLSMFDDFDIDFNQHKYLMETRVSGALTQPKSALVIEKKAVAPVTP